VYDWALPQNFLIQMKNDGIFQAKFLCQLSGFIQSHLSIQNITKRMLPVLGADGNKYAPFDP